MLAKAPCHAPSLPCGPSKPGGQFVAGFGNKSGDLLTYTPRSRVFLVIVTLPR